MRTYIIVRMYAGSYLNDNLGGEAINLLHDDHNHNYIFIPKMGFIDPRYDDTVEGVILTRLDKAGCFQLLGLALMDNNSQVAYKKNMNNGIDILARYIKENDISYGGVSYMDIYKPLHAGDISFRSKKLLLPKNDIYLTDGEHIDYINEGQEVYNLVDKRFSTTSLHLYITDEDNPKSYEQINKLIKDDSLWEKDRINRVDEGRIIDKHFNFLDIIRKDYDELAYSNLFYYIFKTYNDIFRRFTSEVLSVDISSSYKVYREKEHIDLWIEDDKNIIIIENKIKSGINGVSSRHNFSNDGLVQSQLKTYYQYVEAHKDNKNSYYYLFVPNYNKIDLRKYSGSQYYKVIKYKEIYDFFSNIDIQDIYYKEFVNALYKHSKDREVDYAEDMVIRFLSIIKKGKA